jgi:hypothetical protein
MALVKKFGISAITAFLIFLLPSTIVAVGASKKELQQIIEFVQREGKSSTMESEFLLGLEIKGPTIGGPEIPITVT